MKTTEKWFGELLDSYKDDFEFRLETLVFELTEQISKKLKDNKISRKQLAKKLNVSPAAVSKILNGNPNFTLRKLMEIADVLEMELSIGFKSEEISTLETKHVTTTAEDTAVSTKRTFDTSDMAYMPAWMIRNTTSTAA